MFTPGLKAPLDPSPGPAPCLACRQPAVGTVPGPGRTRRFALPRPAAEATPENPCPVGRGHKGENPERLETPQRLTPISPPPLPAGM